MALIQCPECGKEISSKAKQCVYCGNPMVISALPNTICPECGQEIESGESSCPNCGCPIAIQISKKRNKKKRKTALLVSIISITVLMVGVMIFGLILTGKLSITSGECGLTEHEKICYHDAVTMKKIMKNSDSFKLYDDMALLTIDHKDRINPSTITLFKYSGTNSYGVMITNTAVFYNGEFMFNAEEGPDKNAANFTTQLACLEECATYATEVKINKILGAVSEDNLEIENETDYKLYKIDSQVISNAMGLQ